MSACGSATSLGQAEARNEDAAGASGAVAVAVKKVRAKAASKSEAKAESKTSAKTKAQAKARPQRWSRPKKICDDGMGSGDSAASLAGNATKGPDRAPVHDQEGQAQGQNQGLDQG